MKRQRMKHQPGKRKWTPEELAAHKQAQRELKETLQRLANAGFESVCFASPKGASVVKLRSYKS